MNTLAHARLRDAIGPDADEILDRLGDVTLISIGYRGSHAHGMLIPNTDPNSIDDVDLMGVFVMPEDYYLGLGTGKETKEIWVGKYDCVFYEARKMIRMLSASNPNVLSYIWSDREDYIYNSLEWELLLNSRGAFSSNHAYKAFVGYASGQMKKMEAFGGNQGYMGEKRKKLVEKFGYDTKNAAHLIRLLKMAGEFLKTGFLRVKRTDDADFLLDVKKGKYSKEYVIRHAENLFEACKIAREESVLPDDPDIEEIKAITLFILKKTLKL